MKKQIVSTLLALCMLLCLMPTAAFAEESTETPPACSCKTACTAESMNTDCPVCGAEGALPENCAKYAQSADDAAAQLKDSADNPPVCSCETACTAESMNADCPVCGAEGALPDNCAKYAQPAEGAAVQPEGEVSDPQPEAALTALSGEGETPAASGTVTDVSNAADLIAAIADSNVNTVRLAASIDISNTLTVNRTVTLDLNGYALTVGGTELDNIFSVDEKGNLTVKDSGTGGKIDGQNKNCGFCIYGGVLTLESGTITNCTTDGDGGAVDISSGNSEGVYGKFVMNGGAITNCKVTDDSGAVDIGDGCTFIMNSGIISGCRADDDAGAIFIKRNASFVMNGGTIENCFAGYCGGAVKMRGTSSFTMTNGTISNCTAQQGGGVYVANSSTFNMNGGSIANCTAAHGGNSVFVKSGTGGKFTMTDGTVDGSVTLHYEVAGSDVYMDGLGTAAYPYQISTAAQLKLFRDIVNGSNDQTPNAAACAVLTADIDLKNEPWTPIGKYTNSRDNTPYTGTFDGQGHSIKGLYVNSASDANVGLFGYLEGATVRNLTVDGYVQGCDVVSGIAGDARANSTIENCRNNCRVVSEIVTDKGSFLYTGGIVGSAKDSTIAGCANTGVVEARGINNNSYASDVAGVVGVLNGNVTVKNCYNTGEIKVTSEILTTGTAGGIAGSNITGRNTVSDCYNLGAVTVTYTGSNEGYIARVGGIMGNISIYGDTTVSNCYSVGTLTSTTGAGTSYIGGVVGSNENGTVENCYYLDSTAAKAIGNDGGTVDEATGPKTAAQLGDGTVLALLINNRTDSEHPWNSKCQYLAAATKTLPVFKNQTGDDHLHDWSAWTSNGNGTHSHSCSTCNAAETVNCSGGTATCKDKAVCEICKESYGSLDPNSHTDLKHVDAKAATAAAEGNIAYWYCGDCDKYFSDAAATKEITKAATVTAKLPPKITAGDGAAVTQGEKNELAFTSDASFADFLRVELDGTALEEKNYTKREGSTIITLNRDFVATLSVGEHTLSIVSKSGTATAKFTVKAKPTETATPQPTVEPQPTAQPRQTAQPKPTVQPTVQPVSPIPSTGDTANPALWFALLIVSGSALAAIFVLRRKANRK